MHVARGRGHDLLAFKRRFAEYAGNYWLFGLPHIARHIRLHLREHVERVGSSFFRAQVIPNMPTLGSALHVLTDV